ncbi:MAG: hypothetical protein M3P18_16925 [Actinomycetota bacterium]|nr:hypothetical protein [Actinomycetota bacterium]
MTERTPVAGAPPGLAAGPVFKAVWDSIEAIKAFAGEDYEAAVFYPEDDRFLVERDLTAHYDVDTPFEPG